MYNGLAIAQPNKQSFYWLSHPKPEVPNFSLSIIVLRKLASPHQKHHPTSPSQL